MTPRSSLTDAHRDAEASAMAIGAAIVGWQWLRRWMRRRQDGER